MIIAVSVPIRAEDDRLVASDEWRLVGRQQHARTAEESLGERYVANLDWTIRGR